MMRGIIKCKGHDEWLKMRHKYLGRILYNASEMSVYVGDNPYKSAHEAWLEKTEQKPREDLSDNVNILRGMTREPFIRQQFIADNESWLRFSYHQYDIYFIQLVEYVLGATLDLEAVVIAENPYNLPIGCHVIIEFKSVKVTPQTFHDGQWLQAPPVHYQEQQYAQLIATGYTADILHAEFEKEDENGEVYYETRTYAPIVVDQQNLFNDPNVAELHKRLTAFAQCVDQRKEPDKHVQGTDAEIVFKADASLGTFDSNYEEVKQAIALAVAPFKELVVTAETEKEGKSAKARLNKVRKSIEEKRLEVCRKWDEPKNQFNAKCKEIVALVDDAIRTVDKQLQDIENKRILVKCREIEELKSKIIASSFEEQSSLLDYFNQCGGVVYDSRWENRGTAKSAIEKDIQTQIAQFKADFDSIAVFKSDGELYNAMLMAYKRTRRLSDALSAKLELENAREIALKAQQERAMEKATDPEPEIPRPVENPIMENHTQPNTESLYTIGFEVFHVTKSQLSSLNDYLKGNKISFKRTSVSKEA